VKLLFDQNISFRVLRRILDEFPESSHVKDFDLVSASDEQIWLFSKENEYTFVTFDADFYDFATLYGHPPKVIWLRIGNTSTDNLIRVLTSNANTIKNFIADETYKGISCLEIT